MPRRPPVVGADATRAVQRVVLSLAFNCSSRTPFMNSSSRSRSFLPNSSWRSKEFLEGGDPSSIPWPSNSFAGPFAPADLPFAQALRVRHDVLAFGRIAACPAARRIRRAMDVLEAYNR